jgi:hypothetical protein
MSYLETPHVRTDVVAMDQNYRESISPTRIEKLSSIFRLKERHYDLLPCTAIAIFEL